MRISFGARRLAREFSSARVLDRSYGRDMAGKIRARMAVLEAAPNLAKVPTTKPDRCHQLEGERRGKFAVDLVHPHRLVFEPDHDPIPRRPDGGIDLAAITAITIIEIVDYH